MKPTAIHVFFENQADSYSKKLDGSNPLLTHFFNERLEKTTQLADFHGVSVLDIGAGTGFLFDFLEKNGLQPASYFATDISEKMLAASRIPIENRFVGPVWEAPFSGKKFQLITLLGVSSYLTKQELTENLQFIQQNLTPGGCAIISFTNRNSIDFQLRKLLKPLARLFKFNKVLNASFSIQACSIKEITGLTNSPFTIEKTVFLNQTIFPFNRLFPRLAVFLAPRIHRLVAISPALLSVSSSDFLVKIRLR